jgi:hypothetical protein
VPPQPVNATPCVFRTWTQIVVNSSVRMTENQRYGIALAASLVFAFLGSMTPRYRMPIDYHAMISRSIPFAIAWAVIFVFCLWRWKKRGLWLLSSSLRAGNVVKLISDHNQAESSSTCHDVQMRVIGPLDVSTIRNVAGDRVARNYAARAHEHHIIIPFWQLYVGECNPSIVGVVQHQPVMLGNGLGIVVTPKVNRSPCDPTAIVRPNEIEPALHDLYGFTRVRIQHPVSAVRVPTLHRANALVVNPLQSVKLFRNVSSGDYVLKHVSLKIGLDDLLWIAAVILAGPFASQRSTT